MPGWKSNLTTASAVDQRGKAFAGRRRDADRDFISDGDVGRL